MSIGRLITDCIVSSQRCCTFNNQVIINRNCTSSRIKSKHPRCGADHVVESNTNRDAIRRDIGSSDRIVESNFACNDVSITRSITDSGIAIYGQSAIYLSIPIDVEVTIDICVVCNVNSTTSTIQYKITRCGINFRCASSTNLNVISGDMSRSNWSSKCGSCIDCQGVSVCITKCATAINFEVNLNFQGVVNDGLTRGRIQSQVTTSRADLTCTVNTNLDVVGSDLFRGNRCRVS